VFFIDVYMMGACLCIFCLHSEDVMGPWMPMARAIFFIRVFIGKWVIIRVFRGFDGLSSISDSTIMTKILKIN